MNLSHVAPVTESYSDLLAEIAASNFSGWRASELLFGRREQLLGSSRRTGGVVNPGRVEVKGLSAEGRFVTLFVI